MPRAVEGLWVAVPLRTNGYAVGLVARCSKDGVSLGYFFGPKRAEVPAIDEVQRLSPSEAILVQRFGDLGIHERSWPLLGVARPWDRIAWPTPMFVRYEELTGRSFRVSYDDDDPSEVVREDQVPAGAAEQGPRDGLLGSGAVEGVLTELLDHP